ncbi:MAG TPA: HAD-IIB family hydrolase [Calditrichia bacterium]|nr:HAD-IIB family hydrolase [Calditrichia bacterium]
MNFLLVFSDLDGTLLDHHTYSFQPALPAINRLRQLNIPLILCSSKTRSEMLEIRTRLDNHHPFVSENGGAIYTDAGEETLLGKSYREIVAVLEEIRSRDGFRFRGFCDLGEHGVREKTGLPPARVRLAMDRHCSEPIEWQDTEARLEQFQQTLREEKLQVVRGGRFLHVMGFFDKGKALALLRDRYVARNGNPVKTCALGDAPNDAQMLAAADYPIVIAHQTGYRLQPENPGRYYFSRASGPQGWAEAIFQLLEKPGWQAPTPL